MRVTINLRYCALISVLLALNLVVVSCSSPRSVVVTGATKGIGLAIASDLASRPETSLVIICSRGAADVEACVKRLNQEHSTDKVTGCAADVSTAAGRKALVDFAKEKCGGRLDCLINNVGTNIRKPTIEYTEEEVRRPA